MQKLMSLPRWQRKLIAGMVSIVFLFWVCFLLKQALVQSGDAMFTALKSSGTKKASAASSNLSRLPTSGSSWPILLLGFATLAVLYWLKAQLDGKGGIHRYQSRGTLLSPAEQRFHSALLASLPPHVQVCFKVRLADVVECRKGEFRRSSFNKISAKHLDFVLVHGRNSRILAAVELDDASHMRPDRTERDRFVDHALASAGIALVRIRAAGSYDPASLTAQLVEALKPTA